MRQAAVLGHPIGHSQSPLLHAAAYGHLGLAIDYRRIDLPVESLGAFLAAEGADPAWVGWSVTMPLKSAMLKAVDHCSARVRALGVLNTVTHLRTAPESQPRELHAENTDVDGIVAALQEGGLQEAGLRGAARTGEDAFCIIGAGATATAALAAAAELGFTQVTVFARSPQRAVGLQPVAAALGIRLGLMPLTDLSEELRRLPQLQAVVSTLPPRAADELAPQLGPLARRVPLLDVAYDPWPSELAQAWEAAGGAVVSGLSMLLHQAVRQVELFTAQTESPAGQLSSASHAQMVARMRSAIGL